MHGATTKYSGKGNEIAAAWMGAVTRPARRALSGAATSKTKEESSGIPHRGGEDVLVAHAAHGAERELLDRVPRVLTQRAPPRRLPLHLFEEPAHARGRHGDAGASAAPRLANAVADTSKACVRAGAATPAPQGALECASAVHTLQSVCAPAGVVAFASSYSTFGRRLICSG